MFKVAIPHKVQGQQALVLETKSRALARSVVLLGLENELTVKVTEEVKPREVKFKGVDSPS